MRGMALVAIAGPASNFLQALLWSGVMSAFLHAGIWDFDARGLSILVTGIIINVVLMAFNLVPIPPLDGSRVVFYFLNHEARKVYSRFERHGLLIILGLIFFARDTFWSVLYAVIIPVVKFIFWITAVPESDEILKQIFG